MVCSACRKQNPDENRFCGFCGTPLRADSVTESRSTVSFFRKLELEKQGRRDQAAEERGASPDERNQQNLKSVRDRDTEAKPTGERETALPSLTETLSSSRYPPSEYDEPDDRREPTLAADKTLLRPEVIEYDKKIPIIAEPGTDRRHVRDPRKATEEDEAKPSNASTPSRRIRVTDRKATPSSTYGAPSMLGLNAPTADEVGVAGDDVSAIPGEYAPPREYEQRPHFLDVSEAPANQRALHGPSFLGLADDGGVEFADEEESPSHTRRNLALLLLAILIALVAMQWRAIRDFGLKYAQNGTINLKLPKKGQQNSDQATANSQPADPAAVPSSSAPPVATTPAANGKPEMQVEPTQNPNAPKNDSANAGSNANQSPTTPPSSAAPDGSSSQPTQSADNRGGDLPQGEPADEDTADTPDTTPNRSVAKSTPRNAAPQESGTAELAQASSTGDPAQQAMWLWKAVGKGNAEASVRLADMYLDGRGVVQNCDQAMVLLKSAALKKNARARSRMGSLYATGKCVPQDRVVAYHWMTLALQVDPGSEWVSHNRQTLWTQMSDAEKRQAARER